LKGGASLRVEAARESEFGQVEECYELLGRVNNDERGFFILGEERGCGIPRGGPTRDSVPGLRLARIF
jgi:hypothetical protein